MAECKIIIQGEVLAGAYEAFKKQFVSGATSLLVEIVDSPGGLVEEGFAIGEFIRTLKIPTKALIKGYQCASIATYIARTCNVVAWEVGSSPKEKPFFLVHDPRVMGKIDCDEYACTADWFLSVGYDLKDAEHQIKQLYLHKTKAPTNLINELVATEKRMTPQEALEWGFIDEIIETKPTKPKNMIFFDKIKATLAKLFSPEMADKLALEFKNLDITLEDGTMLYVETEDGEVVGKPVFDAEGNPAPNGVHKLQDGRSITVENGVITAVQEVSAETEASEAEAMKPEEEPKATESMTQEAINALVQNSVKEALAQANAQKGVQIQSKANLPTHKPTASQVASASRKGYTPHKLDVLAKAFAENKGFKAPKLEAVNQVLTPDFATQWTGTWASEILIQPAIKVPMIEQIFTILTDVRGKQNLPIASNLARVVKRYGGCGTSVAGDGTTIGNRVLEVCRFEVFESYCVDDFEDTILLLMQQNGLNQNDISGTMIESLIVQLIQEAMTRDLFNIFSFGDSAMSGNDFYGVCDGLWTKLIANSSTAGNAAVKRIGTDITALNQTAGSRAYDYLKEVYENAPAPMRSIAPTEKKFFVTQNIFDNFQTFIETVSGVQGAWSVLQDGVQRLFFRGIEVVPIIAWDEDLQNTDNPFHEVFDTAILYTTPKNHYIGVGAEQKSVRFWYEKIDRTNYFEAFPNLGYEYLADYLQAFKIGLVN